MVTEETVKWARQRAKELGDSEYDIGFAAERAAIVPVLLRCAADKMDNQPESEMVRSFANDYEKLTHELVKRLAEWKLERKTLVREVLIVEGGE